MMTTQKRTQFVVRELVSEAELTACLQLDHTYSTDFVWQMDVREEGDELGVRFRTMRLPRTMQVPYPRDGETLAKFWEKRDCFLIAVTGDVVLGYINMRIDTIRKGWIHDLVVGAPFRRRHIGSALLEQGIRWAQLRRINHLTLEMQTKNHPAMIFARTHGFVFCGFNDHYYANQDIAVFYTKSL
jgi:ribosomal protein S18 acetylase RimI-like enzyme